MLICFWYFILNFKFPLIGNCMNPWSLETSKGYMLICYSYYHIIWQFFPFQAEDKWRS
ncbi:hypothetical protein BDA96_05G028900 [Sorghum bicolor]|uniref:Uncharacterized protein n=1 Tax=Sorghum bicolor TaxID=4558 RepID=A0A921UEE9_SORBI|nr:hypothetical protein BDA96_05G028900 [Sorghum bicolor]